MPRTGCAAFRLIGSCIALAAAALVAAPVVSASVERPVIRGAEVGYFGSGTVAHRISVFVYSSLGPGAGERVTVCVRGVCRAARGHDGPTLAWYSASFSSRPLRMGDPVDYKVIARDADGQTSKTVTSNLLCMHNNGSTPQT